MGVFSERKRAWLSVAIGLAATAVGLSLTFKPFSSLHVLILLATASLIIAGAGELISGRPPTHLWLSRALGLVLIVTGIAVLILPDVTIGLLAIVVGVGLVISGLALVALGVVAASWPDLTVLGVALLVGPAAVILGIGQIIRALWKDEAE